MNINSEVEMAKGLHISVKYIMAGILFLFLLFSANMFGQENFNKTDKHYKTGVKNLICGIKSENTGLKKSSIYFAGKYKITEAVDALTNRLAIENDENIRVLIALALYEIGVPEGFEAIKNLAANDRSEKVRKTSIAIVYR